MSIMHQNAPTGIWKIKIREDLRSLLSRQGEEREGKGRKGGKWTVMRG